MDASRMPWRSTTHDWAGGVDAGHLAEIRRQPARFAPGGAAHLVLEVIAYAGSTHRGQASRNDVPADMECQGVDLIDLAG